VVAVIPDGGSSACSVLLSTAALSVVLATFSCDSPGTAVVGAVRLIPTLAAGIGYLVGGWDGFFFGLFVYVVVFFVLIAFMCGSRILFVRSTAAPSADERRRWIWLETIEDYPIQARERHRPFCAADYAFVTFCATRLRQRVGLPGHASGSECIRRVLSHDD